MKSSLDFFARWARHCLGERTRHWPRPPGGGRRPCTALFAVLCAVFSAHCLLSSVVLTIIAWVLAAAVIGLSFWQLAFGGVSGGSTSGSAVCDRLHPAVWTTGTVTTTCIWSEANSAVRLLAGFLTLLVFGGLLLKQTRFRTERKIVYLLLVCVAWLGTTCWLVLAVWDANEIRLSSNYCASLTNASCSFTPFIITVILEIALWIAGWTYCVFFSVWMRKEDYKRSVGLCGGGGGGRSESSAKSQPLPMASAPMAELDDF